MSNNIPEVKASEGVKLRFTVPQDGEWLKNALSDPGIKDYFPLSSEYEIDDATRRMISFARVSASLTAEYDKKPIGIAVLYYQFYKRLAHQSEFGIVVDKEFRSQGVGSFLLSSLMKLAKFKFHMEHLHLQVYEGNPAFFLYKKFGFTEFGRHKQWLKDKDRYIGRIFMEKPL